VDGDQFQIRVQQGEIVYFTCPQFEENVGTTSIMCSQGTSATRALSSTNIQYLNNVKGTNYVMYLEYSISSLQKTNGWGVLLQHMVDQNNRWSLLLGYNNTSATTVAVRNNAVSCDAGNMAIALNTVYKVAIRVTNVDGNGVTLFQNGLKYNGTLGSPALDLTGGVFQFSNAITNSETIRNFKIYNNVLTDAQLIAMTT
jgi:hypothetical protein